MVRVVMLDAGPLSMVTHPRPNTEIVEWLQGLLAAGATVLVPEIADYELRRELLRAKKERSIRRLDELKLRIGFAPITSIAMLQAAQFWAQARNQGRPTADDSAIDGDMILAAQAATYQPQSEPPVIATTNVGHLFSICRRAALARHRLVAAAPARAVPYLISLSAPTDSPRSPAARRLGRRPLAAMRAFAGFPTIPRRRKPRVA
jgi:toxin FitB